MSFKDKNSTVRSESVLLIFVYVRFELLTCPQAMQNKSSGVDQNARSAKCNQSSESIQNQDLEACACSLATSAVQDRYSNQVPALKSPADDSGRMMLESASQASHCSQVMVGAALSSTL